MQKREHIQQSRQTPQAMIFFFLHLPPSVIQDLSQFAILTAKVLFLQFIFSPHSYFRISQSLWTCLFFFFVIFPGQLYQNLPKTFGADIY